jgi:glycosyltransferase involved in cell wall biosynthesis
MKSHAELPAIYDECNAVLFPVRWSEPQGIVPLEAMALGRPVVATGTGGSGEYLQDAENCLISPPSDPQALAAAVGRLAADPALRARLRAGGEATAAELTEPKFNRRVLAALTAAAGTPH